MPDIYKKSFEEILSDNRLLASVYVPEWKPRDDTDLGVALIEIFSHMQEEIYSRLNRVPDKNFISFLDMIGIKLMPALPATAPVTFSLAQGLQGSILVSAGTQVATLETESHGELTYETVKSFSAIKATIDQVYSVNPEKDEIYSHSEDFNAGKPFSAFHGDNIQKHILYLGHSTLFKLKEPKPILIRMVMDGNVGLEDIRSWRWSRANGKPFSFVAVSRIENLRTRSAISKGQSGKSTDAEENSYQIVLMPDAVIEESSISDITSLWIECSMNAVTEKSNPVVIKKILLKGVSSDSILDPDMAFYNFLPLDLSQKFYPFGMQPRLYDTFYLSSTEAFSKKNTEIKISFKAVGDAGSDPAAQGENILISWEYWNGSIWHVLQVEENGMQNFILPVPGERYIKFNRPDDLSALEVNGVKGYWIRARLANGGYGRDKIESDSASGFKPPWASSVKISYRLTEESFLENCLSYNNLEFKDVTAVSQGKGFKPFMPLPQQVPTLYIGFKEPLLKGNLSLYISMVDEQQSSGITPDVIWSHWTGAPDLITMKNKDQSEIFFASTDGLGVGTDLLFEETFQDEFASETGSISWIRDVAVDSNKKVKIVGLKRKLDHLYTAKARVLKRSRLDVQDNTGHLQKSGTLEMLGPADHQITTSFGKSRYWLTGSMDPGSISMIRGIFPNTVWVMQMESVTDEILGSSSGEKGSRFSLIKRPVISPEVWVKEGAVVIDPGLNIEAVKDSSGKVTDTWVKWNPVDDLFASGPRDRHYALDGASGELIFGDGVHGMIPPIGRNNIRASYKSGGGSKGNVAALEINAIKTPIAGLDSVRNYMAAEGGSDTESIESVLERGPYAIRTMDRAVTAEDFERLAIAASSYVARSRSLVSGSKLNVIVIPRGLEDRPMPSSKLVKIVKEYLLDRSLSCVSSDNLDVVAPDYKEIRIKVDVIPKSIDLAVPLERDIQKKLREFLHPLRGASGNGWEFGRPVRISDIYSLLEETEGVDHVEDLRLNDSSGDVDMGVNQLACSGDHTVTIRLGDQP
jgi:hypothetical protein